MAAEPNPQLHENGISTAHMEKDVRSKNENGNGRYHLHDNMDSETALRHIQTAGSISISPELFEKLYLTPQNQVKGDLRKTFGNPTPVALIGFVLCLTPLSCDLMGWRGAGGNGAAGIGTYYFFGGLLMMLGGFLEFILGNTFPFVVFCSFGAFWLSFAATLQPFYYAYGLYAPATATSEVDGIATVGFTASFGFFLLFMGLLSFIYLICSLRTNVCFVVIFFTLVLGFCLIAGSYWQSARGIGNNDASATKFAGRLLIASGASFFVTSLAGWWILFAIMLATLDFPFEIPVGDLSTMIKGASEKTKVKSQRDMV